MSAVPKLRFKQGNGINFPDWDEVPFESIGRRRSERHKSDQTSTLKIIELENIQSSQGRLTGEIQEKVPSLNNHIFQTNDVLFGKLRPYLKKWFFASFSGACSSEIWVLCAQDGVEPEFLYYLVQSEAFLTFTQLSSGSKMPRADWKVIADSDFGLPFVLEQQKIASFLSSVDKKIDLLRQKKDALELYKKGLMQKIFSQEIRFKQDDGSDFPDWQEVALGDVVKIRTGKKDVNQGNPQGSYPFFTCAKHNTYSDTYSFDCDAILIAGNGEVGHSQRFSGKFEAYQRTYVLSDFKLKFDYTFVVVNNLFKEFVNKQVQTGAMPYIRLSTLKDFLIPCPSPEEQLKIASLFSKIDQKIQNTSSQIEQMETFKKGLLQQMFV